MPAIVSATPVAWAIPRNARRGRSPAVPDVAHREPRTKDGNQEGSPYGATGADAHAVVEVAHGAALPGLERVETHRRGERVTDAEGRQSAYEQPGPARTRGQRAVVRSRVAGGSRRRSGVGPRGASGQGQREERNERAYQSQGFVACSTSKLCLEYTPRTLARSRSAGSVRARPLPGWVRPTSRSRCWR